MVECTCTHFVPGTLMPVACCLQLAIYLAPPLTSSRVLRLQPAHPCMVPALHSSEQLEGQARQPVCTADLIPTITAELQLPYSETLMPWVCSFYIGGVDVFEMQISYGWNNVITVSNRDTSLANDWSPFNSNQPPVNVPWYDGGAQLWGATISTDDMFLPGELCTALTRETNTTLE